MRIATFLSILGLGVCFCMGCNLDSGRTVPPQARNPYTNRIDPENPPPLDKTTPQENASVSLPSEAELGLAVYPDAKPYKDEFGVGAAQVKAEGIVTAILETPDPVDKVLAFYKRKMPEADRTEATEEGKPITRLSAPYGGNGMHTVEVSAVNGKTRLALQYIRPTKSAEELQPPPVEISTNGPFAPPTAPSSSGTLP